MNRNPFVPTPSYPQPPLPQGAQPQPVQGQPDYSSYWASAGAHQPHPPPQPPPPPSAAAYNPQQSALFANYGYGGQQGLHWQQQQNRAQAGQPMFPHPPPGAPQPTPPAATQPGYNPYQPTAGYQQPFVQQAQPFQHPIPQPPQFHVPQHHHQTAAQHVRQNQALHHTPPQQLPPAKRQRFDGPNNRGPAPSQPQFIPPPPPPGGHPLPSHPLPQGPNRGGQHGSMGNASGRGGGGGGMRGGGGSGGSGGGGGGGSGRRNGPAPLNRGGSMSGGRGGGRGGHSGGSQRGGGQGGQTLRGHGSRSTNNLRKGGSFSAGGNDRGGGHHQSGGSLRNRGQTSASGRSGRHDHGQSHGGPKDALFAKKDENRRTFTDFKLVGLEIKDLDWAWGVIPPLKVDEAAPAAEAAEAPKTTASDELDDEVTSQHAPDTSASLPTGMGLPAKPVAASVVPVASSAPPSRVRIYFHTPVSADDTRPLPAVNGSDIPPSDVRKGKRKKSDDDDGDLENDRVRRPPPRMEGFSEKELLAGGRESTAASIADTGSVSEADWLMAAMVEGEDGSGDGEPELRITDADDGTAEGGHEDGGDVLQIEPNEGTDVDPDEQPQAIVEMEPPDNEHSHAPMSDNIAAGSSIPVLHDGTGSSPDAGAIDPADVDEADEVTYSLTQVTELDGGTDSSVTLAEPASGPPISPPIDEDKQSTADHASKPHINGDDQPSLSVSVDKHDLVSADGDISLHESTLHVVVGNTDEVRGNEHATADDKEHLPEPPASPTSKGDSAQGDDTAKPPVINFAKPTARVPSANRVSISFANLSRRLVIDAEVVEKLTVNRASGKIEIVLNINEEKEGGLKGILIEGLSEETKSYLPLRDVNEGYLSDPAHPPFLKTAIPYSTILAVYLDTARPLSEPRWIKTGDVQEWLKSMFGRMFWVAGDAAAGWEKKVEVIDPDPAPTITTVLDGWAANSPVGTQAERQRFLKTHMADTDNILEILLRLVRGERATPFTQSSQSSSAQSIAGPLLSAITPGFAHGSQQTHVSLAVLSIFRFAVEYAKKADAETGQKEVEDRVGDLIRCLPSHLIYKSVDGMFKEWKSDKRGGGR